MDTSNSTNPGFQTIGRNDNRTRSRFLIQPRGRGGGEVGLPEQPAAPGLDRPKEPEARSTQDRVSSRTNRATAPLCSSPDTAPIPAHWVLRTGSACNRRQISPRQTPINCRRCSLSQENRATRFPEENRASDRT